MPFDMNKSRQYWKIERYNRELDWIRERGSDLMGYMKFYKAHKRGSNVESQIFEIWKSDMQALMDYFNALPYLR